MTTIILLLLNFLGIMLIVFFLYKKEGGNNTEQITKILRDFSEKSDRVLKDEMSINRKESADSEKRLREELANSFRGFGEPFDKRMSELIEKVEGKLVSLQKDNSEKLEAMRATVDEKLHATLEKRFGESFKMVSERLELVHKGLGEMQVVASGVGDLKKVLNNVKTRGTWGEAQLGNLIEEIFTPDQYEKNVKTKKASKDNVEYAIKLPGSEDNKHIWLPIDAKFPLEDYQRLVEAQEQGNLILVEELGKALENRIKSEAKDIRDKYIDIPNTTDFGILFVPTESLYAEILRRPGLYELLRRDYKVIITGPTTIQVILNSLNVGFKTLNIQKRSGEVWAILSTVKTEFGKFGDLLEKTHKKIQEAGNVIEEAITKTRTIEKKFNKVQSAPGLEAGEAAAQLPEADATVVE